MKGLRVSAKSPSSVLAARTAIPLGIYGCLCGGGRYSFGLSESEQNTLAFWDSKLRWRALPQIAESCGVRLNLQPIVSNLELKAIVKYSPDIAKKTQLTQKNKMARMMQIIVYIICAYTHHICALTWTWIVLTPLPFWNGKCWQPETNCGTKCTLTFFSRKKQISSITPCITTVFPKINAGLK